MHKVNYEIVDDTPPYPLVIRDLGPFDQCMTITNAAEPVVEELCGSGTLIEGRRLWYYDSSNELDELLVKDGKFDGFSPIPDKEKKEFEERVRGVDKVPSP